MTQETSTNTAPGKIPHNLQHEICRKLAAFMGPTKIAEWLKVEHGIEVDKSAIVHYKAHDKWKDQFQRYRAEWQAGTRDMFPLANVSGRVGELTKLYTDAWKRYQKADTLFKSSAARHCQEILEQIQTELPGSEVSGSAGVININLPENVKQGLFIQKDKGE